MFFLGGQIAATATPITFVASAVKQNTANATTLVITKPTGTVDGDIMIAFMGLLNGVGTWTPPAGWTKLSDTSSSSMAYKVASGEGANYTFTDDVSDLLSGVIVTYRYAAYDGSVSANYSLSNPIVATTITATVNSSLLIAAYLANSTGQTFSAPSGMLVLVSDSDATYAPSWAVFTQGINAGATGSRSSTVSPSLAVGTFAMIALKPA